MRELLSMRAYARRRGVSVEAVSKAVKRGRISTVEDADGKRKIDPAIADVQWTANSDPSKFQGSNSAPPPLEEETPTVADEPKVKGPSYQQSRAIREALNARLLKLQLDEKSGRLVDGEEIRKLWTTVAGIVRTKVLGIPSKLRQQVPDIRPDQYDALDRIVRETLEELANERG